MMLNKTHRLWTNGTHCNHEYGASRKNGGPKYDIGLSPRDNNSAFSPLSCFVRGTYLCHAYLIGQFCFAVGSLNEGSLCRELRAIKLLSWKPGVGRNPGIALYAPHTARKSNFLPSHFINFIPPPSPFQKKKKKKKKKKLFGTMKWRVP